MLKKNSTPTYLVLASAIALVIGLFSAGCKEEPTESISSSGSEPQGASATAQEEATEPVQEAEPEPVAEPVVEEAKSAVESQAQIARIVAGARTWGAVNQSWYGKAAPDFEMTALDGTDHKLSDYKGKKVLLVFWATWCPPCRAEIPDLNELHGSIDGEKMAIVAVTGNSPGHAPEDMTRVKPFAEGAGIKYDVFIEKGEMPDPFGVGRLYTTTGIPGSFIIDAEGIIRLQTAGIVPRNDIEGLLDAI